MKRIIRQKEASFFARARTVVLRHEALSIFIFVLIASAGLYANSIFGGFVFDDAFISERPDLASWSSLFHLWLEPFLPGNPHAGMYRPVPMFSFVLNALFFGKTSWSFHLISIVLNALSCFVLWLIARRLFKDPRLAFCITVFFAFLPIHTEAVSYIKARDELLSTICSLLAWLFFLHATSGSRILSMKKALLSGVLFLLAVLSKEFAIVVPLIFFLVYAQQHGLKKLQRILPICFIYAVAALAYFGLRFIALGSEAFSTTETLMLTMNPLSDVDTLTRVLTAFKLACIAIWKSIIPLNLTATYSFNHVPLVTSFFESWQAIVGFFSILGLIVFAALPRFRKTPLGIGALFFLVTYVPMSKFFFAKKLDMFGERWMYLPTIGIAMMIGYCFFLAWKKYSKVTVIVFLIVIALYTNVIVHRNLDWATSRSLYESMIRTSPDSVVGYTNLAQLSMSEGNFIDAKEQILQGLQVTEQHPPLLQLFGLLAIADHRYELARQAFDAASILFPADEASYIYLSIVAAKQQQYEEGVSILLSHFNTLSYAPVRFLLSVHYAHLGQRDKAAEYLDWDTQDPDFKRYFTFPPLLTDEEKWKIIDDFSIEAPRTVPWK